MFAGPNGSGKSTLKTILPSKLPGVYLNPDELENKLKQGEGLDLRRYDVAFSESEVRAFFRESSFLKQQGPVQIVESTTKIGDRLFCERARVNSYVASVMVDFLRHRLVESRVSFTFETVMSHPGKVAFFKERSTSWLPNVSLLCRHGGSRDQRLPRAQPGGAGWSRCAGG